MHAKDAIGTGQNVTL